MPRRPDSSNRQYAPDGLPQQLQGGPRGLNETRYVGPKVKIRGNYWISISRLRTKLTMILEGSRIRYRILFSDWSEDACLISMTFIKWTLGFWNFRLWRFWFWKSILKSLARPDRFAFRRTMRRCVRQVYVENLSTRANICYLSTAGGQYFYGPNCRKTIMRDWFQQKPLWLSPPRWFNMNLINWTHKIASLVLC